MNYAMRWFYHNVVGEAVPLGTKRCAVCGLPTSSTIGVCDVLRKTFTNYDLLKAPASDVACEACAWYFDHSELRRQHWYLTASEARVLAKADILPLLVEHLHCPPDEERYYLIAQSKKKHVALRAVLNAPHAAYLRVNLEEVVVRVNERWVELMWNVVALRKYHAWREIENDRYLSYAIMKWPSLVLFEKARQFVRPWLGSSQFALARYLYSPKLQKGGQHGN